MPAASCRIMPARSISRCDTISASFGFSLRMGRKKRDSRMSATLAESAGLKGISAVKPDRTPKYKGATADFPAVSRTLLHLHAGMIVHLLHVHLAAAGRPHRADASDVEHDRDLAGLCELQRDRQLVALFE